MSSSKKIDNRKKYILILGKGPTQGLEHTLTAEKMYSVNFVWSCIIMEQIVICLFGKEIHKFNTKDSEIVATPLCLLDFWVLFMILMKWKYYLMKKNDII